MEVEHPRESETQPRSDSKNPDRALGFIRRTRFDPTWIRWELVLEPRKDAHASSHDRTTDPVVEDGMASTGRA